MLFTIERVVPARAVELVDSSSYLTKSSESLCSIDTVFGKENSSLPLGPETSILESSKDTSAPLIIDIGFFATLDIIKILHKLFRRPH